MCFHSYKNTEQQKKSVKLAEKHIKAVQKFFKKLFKKNELFSTAIRIRIQNNKNGGRKIMKKLIKTILFAAIGFSIGTVVSGGEFAIQMGIGFMGFPAGFAFTSRYFIGYNLVTIALHLAASILIGWIILPFSLASGVIQTYKEVKARG